MKTSHSNESPSIVIRSKVVSKFIDMEHWEYHIVKKPSVLKLVDRKTAFAHIKEHNLVLVYDEVDGQIYDSPDHAFQKMHKGFFARQEQAEREKFAELRRKTALRRAEKYAKKLQNNGQKGITDNLTSVGNDLPQDV